MRANLIRWSSLGACATLVIVLMAPTAAFGQTAPFKGRQVPVQVDSGLIENTGAEPTVVFATTIDVPGATWLRLKFDEVQLAGNVSAGNHSHLLVTSLLDGAYQYLNAVHVEQWQYTSAYFNGDAVLIELVAQPGTGANRLVLSEVTAGEPDTGGLDSICGSVDDRILSYDKRCARTGPGGCSTWMINDCNHCFITAGHCTSSMNMVEFNVPLSSSSGTIRHPGPEDQYSVDSSSLQRLSGGRGNDWAYFGCFPNSSTGKTPYQTQGDAFDLAMPPSPSGKSIRITGYGTVSSPVSPTWNQVQKTHVGPFVGVSGTKVRYATDTTGGNSGSPVILENTGDAIGVHGYGGCNTYGYNEGTGTDHAQWQAALANPKGVCQCAGTLQVTPTSNLSSSGYRGGPFSPVSIDYTLKNIGASSIDYQVTKSVAWVSLTNATGSLAAGATKTVTVSINSNANSLEAGTYNDTVSFVNTTNHQGDTTRSVTLEVKDYKLGDMNCDGKVDFDDIDPFVLALAGQGAYQAQYPDCRWLNADCNEDGKVDFEDIDPFVALIGG